MPGQDFDSTMMRGVNRQVFWRSFFLETLWNYENMQNVGFVFCIYPALSRLFPDRKERESAIARNLERLNTQPSMGPLLAGLIARLEHDMDASAVLPYRKLIMSTLAAHGDHIFWGHVKPLAAIFGVIITLCFFGSVAGSMAVLVIYNVPNLLARFLGFSRGWTQGLNILQTLHSPTLDRAMIVARLVLALGLGVAAGLVVFSAKMFQQSHPGEVGPWVGGTLVVLSGVAGALMLKRQVPLAVVTYLISLASLMMLILAETGIRF
jgi:mannose/fructose/N-acetylgalactosamine-specific phosphotransferase system component IID